MNAVGRFGDEVRFNSGRLTIKSPARLHFGLTEIFSGEPSLFSGCGMTIDEPSTHMSLEVVALETSSRLVWQIECDSPWKERIEAALMLAGPNASTSPWKFVFRLGKPPLAHTGLGSGTQLACCVATLIASAQCSAIMEEQSVAAHRIWTEVSSRNDSNLLGRLAEASGRGARSCVGLASHLFGGFIVDHGIRVEDQNVRRVDRFSQPESWRVLLVRPKSSTTVSGVVEIDYFRRCASVNTNRDRMIDLMENEMVPAIRIGNLKRFGEAVYDYGRLGGELFRAVQGGVYRDAAVTAVVESIRGMGIKATGQTSWGPTVYAIVENMNEAASLEESLRNRWGAQITTTIARPSNQSSLVSRFDS